MNCYEYINIVFDFLEMRFFMGESFLDVLFLDGIVEGFDKVSVVFLFDLFLMISYYCVVREIVD